MRKGYRYFSTTMCAALAVCVFAWDAGFCAVRIKDIAKINGVRDNVIYGYGLVVGLDGTGDTKDAEFTLQAIANMMTKMGVITNKDDIKVDNVAAVMVTATIKPFSKTGTRFDVLISSLGNATSLVGGTLLLTPLKGPDGAVYAVAQGPVSVGGAGISTDKGGSAKKNHLTVGSIPNGAILEKEVQMEYLDKGKIYYTLMTPDFTSATRLASAINKVFPKTALPVDSATVEIKPPVEYMSSELIVFFISQVEALTIDPDMPARIIVNERTGTIVAGENVTISKVAISHGNISITVTKDVEVYQPKPLAGGETVVVPKENISMKEEEARFIVVEQQGPSVGDLAKAMNALGVTPRDMVAIFQAIKRAGGINAELEIM